MLDKSSHSGNYVPHAAHNAPLGSGWNMLTIRVIIGRLY
jgi:hypothetical protein